MKEVTLLKTFEEKCKGKIMSSMSFISFCTLVIVQTLFEDKRDLLHSKFVG